MSHPRPDLPGMQGLNDLAASLDPQRLGARMQEQLRKIEAVQEQVRELRGTAASDDQFIEATYTTEDGFDGLTLDPRAMRMPSEDLAAEIVRVAQLARDDYHRQHRELMAETGQNVEVDPEEVMAEMQDISSRANRGLGEVEAMFEQFRDRLGRM